MASTHSPVLARGNAQTDPASALSDLHDRLDSLWISYLRHLDAYTIAQKTLQQHMRAGFFSLSRANFKARPGMRYGQDYFHDRAVATRRVEVVQDHGEGSDGKLELAIAKQTPISDDKVNDGTTEKEGAAAEEGMQQPSPPATPTSEDSKTKLVSDQPHDDPNAAKEVADDGSNTEGAKSKPPLEADPIRWYGILVPQELRIAQASFSTAMNEDVVGAVNAGRAMREVEVEIRRLRKEIRRAEKAAKA